MADPLTSPWWLDRLYAKLVDRQRAIDLAERWYCGPHPTPLGYAKAETILARLQSVANANFCGLIVDAAAERMHIEGFRIGGNPSNDARDIWQSNGCDLSSELVIRDSMALGEASMLVDPARNADGQPTVTPEHPSQTIVECSPGRMRDRAAGLKVWIDELRADPQVVATVYLPDRIETFRAPKPQVSGAGQRLKFEYQESESGPHELGEVPLVPFPNRPRMMSPGTPEFDRVLPIQQRINKTLLDRLVLQEFGAFKQKYAAGMVVELDEDGNPKQPINPAIDRLLTSDDPDVKFGQFDADDPRPLLEAVDADVKQMAAIVPTPPHYLLGDLVNLSAEALKAAEASLVSRVRMHMRHLEEPFEAVMRLALRAAGKDSPTAASMRTRWKNPEFRTEGELVDALTKMASLGVPNEALWERWGADDDELERWKTAARRQAITQAAVNVGAALNAAAPVVPTAGPGV